MKIQCQLPIAMPREAFRQYYDLLMLDYQMFKDEDTDIRIRDVPTGLTDPGLIGYFGLRALNDAEIVKTMLGAESEGVDAIAGACYFDSGIKIASSLLSIPVAGAAESAMHLASLMGEKFAVITSEPAWVMEMTQRLANLGFKDRAISHQPVRSLSLAMDDLFDGIMRGDLARLIDDFSTVAKTCLADGAEVLIAGCGLISPVFSTSGIREISGAPIVDPMIASLKTAELMVNLSRAGMPIKPMRGLYRRPAQDMRRKGLSDLNLSA